jgi:addiction module RelE/StbE family toxin
MRIEWTLKALGGLQEAGEFIAEDNPQAASKMAQRVQEAVENLIDHANLGRPGRVPGTRELVVSGTPLIVVYRVRGATVQVLRVLHHFRKWL